MGAQHGGEGRRGAVVVALLVAAMLNAVAAEAHAQMPRLPVLQNGFAAPGFTVAVNYGETRDAQTFAAAGSWTPASARFQLSAGIGLLDVRNEDAVVSGGVRGAVPVLSLGEGNGGVSAFLGVGGAKPDEGSVITAVGGAGGGWRFTPSPSWGLSPYVSPMYRWTRNAIADGSSNSAGLFRVALAVDVWFLDRYAVTIGTEIGQEADAGEPGPSGRIFGFGASYIFR